MEAKIKQEEEKEIFKVYISECARFICENTAKAAGGGYMTVSYYDLLHPDGNSHKQKEYNFTNEEAIDYVMNSLGLE